MPPLSTVLLAMLGCAVHLGVMPVATRWRVAEVSAPVAEPGVEAWVGEALVTALAARGAHDGGGEPLRVTITEAAWVPTRRSGDALLYEARLVVRVEAGGREATRTRAFTARDPGTAAAGRAAREDAFRALARAIADDLVAWALAP